MKTQRCYGGVRYLGPNSPGPSPRNIQRMDNNARPFMLQCMERGMRVDLSHFEMMEKTLTEDMEKVTDEVYQATGHLINLSSPPQIAELLFKKLGLKQARVKMTPSDDRESVESEVLVAIQHDHPAVPLILKYKEYDKLRGTYVVPMPKLARRVGHGHWRMFPKVGDTRVPSSRWNCKEPNLLAMPNRTKRGRQICEGFITDEGWELLSVDESQIEPRVVAHRSKDTALCDVYHNGEDIYSDFAISAFRLEDKRFYDKLGGWQYPGVDKKRHRFPSKTCTLASIYDVTNIGLLEQMPIVCASCGFEGDKHYSRLGACDKFYPLWNEDNCQDIINAFYLKYGGILKMRFEDHRRARRHGFVWDDWGRILHCTGVYSSLNYVVSATLRELGNFPIQATAHGTVQLAKAQYTDTAEAWGLKEVCHPLLDIHDELLFECRKDMTDEVGELVKGIFENIVELDIPLKAGVAKSDNWGTLQK